MENFLPQNYVQTEIRRFGDHGIHAGAGSGKSTKKLSNLAAPNVVGKRHIMSQMAA